MGTQPPHDWSRFLKMHLIWPITYAYLCIYVFNKHKSNEIIYFAFGTWFTNSSVPVFYSEKIPFIKGVASLISRCKGSIFFSYQQTLTKNLGY